VSRQVVAEEDDQKALRVSLDVNIWVAHQLAVRSGCAGGAATELVNIVLAMECEAGPIQLVMSREMIATLEDVLTRLNFDSQSISDFSASLILLMRSGPEAFDPYLLPESGRHLPMKDEEDAGVLASAIAARIDLLVTNNLDDFQTKDAERIGAPRNLNFGSSVCEKSLAHGLEKPCAAVATASTQGTSRRLRIVATTLSPRSLALRSKSFPTSASRKARRGSRNRSVSSRSGIPAAATS
jgi:predicted nucleic acid-binding protein